MQLIAIITSIVAAVTCVSARGRPPLAKREIGGVLICNGANATGACHYEVYSLQDCHNMPEGFSGNTKTFAPDGDAFYCYPKVGQCDDICTSPTGCTFGAVSFYNPVKWDLSSIKWDHLIESFDCYQNQTTKA
ncbi:uncharacterized protein F4807DRAFT_303929 [Annulohypoxylon truncatum]|uniref:uncharacterized protein n=1 Tax=Annulohypoxylon truncatum TaxID=327061 RepID=UPI002007738D|nr:uncharacterized protein F4807DRAFT_303929 [Annulohypoxylon truncatum]KAI1212896.1 hypothetical protein F4807DRAFT_303929 [Annulohypoxylon truncatum]